MELRRVVVTGLGIVSPLGCGIEPTWANILAGNSGASKIEDFDLHGYEDQYVVKLKKLITAKVEGREVVQAVDHEEPKILNLMDALKKSVAEAQSQQLRGSGGGSADDDGADAVADEATDKKLAPSTTGKKKRSRKAQGE